MLGQLRNLRRVHYHLPFFVCGKDQQNNTKKCFLEDGTNYLFYFKRKKKFQFFFNKKKSMCISFFNVCDFQKCVLLVFSISLFRQNIQVLVVVHVILLQYLRAVACTHVVRQIVIQRTIPLVNLCNRLDISGFWNRESNFQALLLALV